MNADGAGALPAWAASYLPEFQRISHSIELSSGFVLFPIELPGSDVAHVLANWLLGQGHPTLVVEPETPDGWGALAASLNEAAPGKEGVVMVIGARGAPEGMRAGLRILNQRRDSTARHLGRPLLWCGPKGFLDETWREAPDFWSVASVPRRLVAKREVMPAPIAMESTMWTGNSALDLPERLDELYQAAKMQGDVHNAARIGVNLAGALGARSEFKRARDVAVEVRTLLLGVDEPGLLAETLLTFARIAWVMRDYHEAEIALDHVLRLAPGLANPRLDAIVLNELGNLYRRTDRANEAETAYQRALLTWIGMDETHGQAITLTQLGTLYAETNRADEAESAFTEAIRLLTDAGDRNGQANAFKAFGDFLAQTDRLREAESIYQKALPFLVETKNSLTQATTLIGLARVAHAQGNFASAFQYGLRALQLFRHIDDPINVALLHIDLATTITSTGNHLRSVVLLGRALRLVTNVDDHLGACFVLMELQPTLDALGRKDQATAAGLLAIHHGRRIVRQDIATQLQEQFEREGLPTPKPEDVAEARQLVDTAIAECEAELEARGEDPYSPLT